MRVLDDVKDYMDFWGWESGGGPGSVKRDVEGKVIAAHGDRTWIADVDRACQTLQRLVARAAVPPS
jgi:hypothetical protein